MSASKRVTHPMTDISTLPSSPADTPIPGKEEKVDGRLKRSADTKKRLLLAGATAFSERGFHATTTRDIAASVGMSSAALYVHHKSKEALLFQICMEGHERVTRLLRDTEAAVAAAGQTSAGHRLHALVYAFSAHHARAHVVAKAVNYELNALSEEHLTEVNKYRAQIIKVFSTVIEEGSASGEFAANNIAATTAGILSLGVDLARWYTTDHEWTPEEVGVHYANLALRMAGARLPSQQGS